MPTLTIPKKSIRNGAAVLKKRRYEVLARENAELRSALAAILEGEQALRLGKTRSFKTFLKAEFPEYAENK